MDWLKDVAPTIFSAVTGNIPGAAISALAFVADKMGWSGTADQIKKKIETLSPEQRIKISNIDLEYAKEESRLRQAVMLDRQDARNREIELAKIGKKDYLQQIVAYFVLFIFSTMVFVIITKNLPMENRDMYAVIVGIITGAFKDIVQYLFGSSKGSADKSKELEKRGA